MEKLITMANNMKLMIKIRLFPQMAFIRITLSSSCSFGPYLTLCYFHYNGCTRRGQGRRRTENVKGGVHHAPRPNHLLQSGDGPGVDPDGDPACLHIRRF